MSIYKSSIFFLKCEQKHRVFQQITRFFGIFLIKSEKITEFCVILGFFRVIFLREFLFSCCANLHAYYARVRASCAFPLIGRCN